MSVSLFTELEVAGTGLSDHHGNLSGGIRGRLNELITLANANETALAGASNPFNYAGDIAAAADFPASPDKGDVYHVTADCIDNDATKTNTGQHFFKNSVIWWDGTSAWIDNDALETGIVTVVATPYTVADGIHTVLVDTATIGAPSVVNLPTAVALRVGREIQVIDLGSGAAANPISVTPQGADQIDNIAAAYVINTNDGAAGFTCGAVGEYYTVPSVKDLASHAAVTANAHGKVMGTALTIDMVAPAANPVLLNGHAASQFIPKELWLIVDAGAAGLAGALTITVGTSVGGVEIMGATVIPNLTAAGQLFRIVLAGLLPEIAGNAALDISVTVGDAGGGAAGTMTGYIIGEEV